MRTKTELGNVVKALNRQRERLPEYSFKGENYWHTIDAELFYVRYLIKFGSLPNYIEGHGVKDCYDWLSGEGSEDYYEDILIELICSTA